MYNFFLRIVSFTFLLVIYAYLEWLGSLGYLLCISVGVISYFLYSKGSIPLLLAGIHMAWNYYFNSSFKIVTLLIFAVIDSIFVSSGRRKTGSIFIDDDEVPLITHRPHEREIRALLFAHKPSILHEVDSMLDRHAGRERELLAQVKDMCNQDNKKSTANINELETATSENETSSGSYKKQIRSILFKYDLEALVHEYELFEAYKGRERELLDVLRVKYPSSSSTVPSSSSPSYAGVMSLASRGSQLSESEQIGVKAGVFRTASRHCSTNSSNIAHRLSSSSSFAGVAPGIRGDEPSVSHIAPRANWVDAYSNGSEDLTPSTTTAAQHIQFLIRDLLARHDPIRLRNIDSMFAAYCGREEELLSALEVVYAEGCIGTQMLDAGGDKEFLEETDKSSSENEYPSLGTFGVRERRHGMAS